MTRERLTLDTAKDMPYDQLIQKAYDLLAVYEAPEAETPSELDRRISQTLDQLPDLYAWFNQLHAWFSHWADFYYNKEQSGCGPSSLEYKGMKNKRDAMEKLASSAKLRYEGTSRRLTQLMGRDEEARMPRGRG